MYLYRLLSLFLPDKIAGIITCILLALLLTMVVFCAFEPQLSFKYGRM